MSHIMNFATIDVSNDIPTLLSEELNIVYIPALLGQIPRAIHMHEPSALLFDGYAVSLGETPFDANKMCEYMSRWSDTAICCDYANIMICHMTQDDIDMLSRKCCDGAVIAANRDM